MSVDELLPLRSRKPERLRARRVAPYGGNDVFPLFKQFF
jgi:hypothetical protein